MAVSDPGGRGQEYEGAVKPDLLDFLFTLALMIGIAPEVINQEGLLSRTWRLTWPSWAFVFDILTFLVGIMTLLFSWYGFNASVSQKPVLYGSVSGLFRFFLDAFLVVLYGFILMKFENFPIVFTSIVVIYFLYTVWDALKLIEYRNPPFDEGFRVTGLCHRTFLKNVWGRGSAIYAVILSIVWILYVLGSLDFLGEIKDWLVLILLLILTVIYRVDKVDWQTRGREETIDEILEDNNRENGGDL